MKQMTDLSGILLRLSTPLRTGWMALLLLILPLLFTACTSASRKDGISSLAEKKLPRYGIEFYFPSSWFETSDDYFYFKVVGIAPNHLPASLEYRGLESEELDETGRDLYAEGWYEAITKNYPDWKYDFRKKSNEAGTPAYLFEGTYRVASDTYRKIGKLIFHGKRIHAIYFTGQDRDFDKTRKLFESLENKIRYLD